MFNKDVYGFTLLEIAVALLIISVIAGTIVAGKSMIRASEIRNFIKEMDVFRTNMHVFEAKYQGKAGDIVNATSFWGELDSDNATCITTTATDMRTCNGNGDGRLEAHEGFRMWQHLSNAGLMNGQFTGTAGALGVNDAVPSINVPESAINNIFYMVQHFGNANFRYFNTVRGNILFIGKSDRMFNNQPWIPFLTSQETRNIDVKLDDGLPVTGSIIAHKEFIALPGEPPFQCTTSNDEAIAEYNLAKNGIICSFSLLVD